jgi:hypothetical protein
VKYLQITNLALLALGLVLTIILAVECLIYAIYLDADPVVRRQLPMLLQFTAVLGGFTITALLAFLGHRWRKVWRWPAQLLPALGLAAALGSLYQLQG